jgi:hypothetical protein
MSDKGKRWSRQAERLDWFDKMSNAGLDDAEVRLLLRIGCRRNDVTGQCNPAVATLAQQIRKSPRQVQRMLKKLRALNWINYVDNKGGRGPDGLPKTTEFTLTQPGQRDSAKQDIQPKPGHSSVPLAGPAKEPDDDEPIWKKPPAEFLERQNAKDVEATQPRHGDVTLEQSQPRHLDVSVNPDICATQPRHLGGSKPVQPRHPDVTRTLREPEENLSAEATAPLADGSRPLPQAQEASKQAATEDSKEESRTVVAGLNLLVAKFKAGSNFKPKAEPRSPLPDPVINSAPPAVEAAVAVPDIPAKPPRKPRRKPRSRPPADSASLKSEAQIRTPPANGSHGHVNGDGEIELPRVVATPEGLAEARAYVDQLRARRDRINGDDSDAQLRRLKLDGAIMLMNGEITALVPLVSQTVH